jgi:hypothetical protein
MASSLRYCREGLDRQLMTELLKAEVQLKQAPPERHAEALRHYEEALGRFSRLVVYGQLPGESGVRWFSAETFGALAPFPLGRHIERPVRV